VTDSLRIRGTELAEAAAACDSRIASDSVQAEASSERRPDTSVWGGIARAVTASVGKFVGMPVHRASLAAGEILPIFGNISRRLHSPHHEVLIAKALGSRFTLRNSAAYLLKQAQISGIG
jgi:hypothetical protein